MNLTTRYSAYDKALAFEASLYGKGQLTQIAPISASPDFVDPAAGDYSLRSTSPLVGAGDPAGLQPGESGLDLGGSPRVVGPRTDVGAYENQTPPKPPVKPVAPKLQLLGSKKQKLGKQHAVALSAVTDKPAKLAVAASVKIAGSKTALKLKKLTLTAAAKKTAQIRLVLSGKTLKAIGAALAAHRGVTAVVQVTATGAGGSAKASRSVQLSVK